MLREREQWVDDVKVFACILVALGHFLRSMISSGIVSQPDSLDRFIDTIYYFHVPLFFICSGYLHQRQVGEKGCWSFEDNVLRKALTLGIPYGVFSVITWLLKAVFSASVEIRNEGLLQTLLLTPASPYWYLYTLFFIFAVTPRFRGGIMALAGLGCALVLKGLRLMTDTEGLFALYSLADYGIWFVLGMCLHFVPGRWAAGRRQLTAGVLLVALFLGATLLYRYNWHRKLVNFSLTVVSCAGFLLIFRNLKPGKRLRRVWDLMAAYTVPVFLMHTIFAAGLRAVLLKLGIDDLWIHVVLGIGASFLGPAAAAKLLERLRLDAVLYPGKYLKKRKS